MTAIRLLRSGLNVAGAVRARGDVCHVDDDVAGYLCSSGQAEQVREQRVAPETTALHSTAGRTRTRTRETR